MAKTATPDACSSALTTCAQLADQLLVDVRGVVAMLRVDDGIDLAAALTALIPSLPRPRVVLDVAPDLRVPRLDPAQTLLRCAQEGLTNALRHADADNVRIRLAAQGEEIVLEIEDDGQAATMPTFGNGLRGMSERLAAVGGTMVFERIDDGGLRLRVVLPFTDPP
jgi:signal transduction histidine kinase